VTCRVAAPRCRVDRFLELQSARRPAARTGNHVLATAADSAATRQAVTHDFRLAESDAADVVQATWLRLLEHIDRIEQPARVGSWLAATAERVPAQPGGAQGGCAG
jgi:hypothetical protein